jgi:DNA-binding GntR family transcriptional regulator
MPRAARSIEDTLAGLSPLALTLALKLAEMIRDSRLPAGSHLREEPLALSFEVSRSPVRDALKALAALGVVVHRPNRGFFAEPAAGAIDALLKRRPQGDEARIYRAIAARRLANDLPEAFTEADLGRLFDLSRAEVSRVTDRMAREGWIEPRPGYGWSFVPVLTTPDAFAHSYRFRLTIEPAALLEPSFAIDREAFAACRREQEMLVAGGMRDIDPVQLFGFGSTFHEMLMRCSGNVFFVDAIERVNRLRRLLEYQAMVEPRQFVPQARQHLEILDAVEAGDRVGAANLLRVHLDQVREVKLQVLGRAAKPRAANGARTLHLHF